jgi:hypothetical protein
MPRVSRVPHTGAPVPISRNRYGGQHQIDAEHLGVRKRQAGVEQQQASAALEDGHVLAHLAEPAQRDDPNGIWHQV